MKWPIIILLLFSNSKAQLQKQTLNDERKDTLNLETAGEKEKISKIQNVFQKIETGIKTGEINKYEKEIGSLISITIGSGEHGYYSASQAVSVLINYFSIRKPISFKFTKIMETASSPYATGRFVFMQKGIQESAQIYISLTLQDSLWVVNQFNIY